MQGSGVGLRLLDNGRLSTSHDPPSPSMVTTTRSVSRSTPSTSFAQRASPAGNALEIDPVQKARTIIGTREIRIMPPTLLPSYATNPASPKPRPPAPRWSTWTNSCATPPSFDLSEIYLEGKKGSGRLELRLDALWKTLLDETVY